MGIFYRNVDFGLRRKAYLATIGNFLSSKRKFSDFIINIIF